jgi:hypothetical protein
VIIVPPSQLLAAMPGVELVPLADGRALIALEEHVGLSDFELLVRDTMEQQDVDAKERTLLSEISAILGQARRDARLTLRRILFLRAQPPRSPAKTTTRSR